MERSNAVVEQQHHHHDNLVLMNDKRGKAVLE